MSALDAPARTPAVIRWLVLATFIVILNETIMINAIPRLMGDFGITPRSAQWLSTVFMLTMAAVIPLTGWFLQRVSTRTAYAVAMATFCAGTALAAVAPTFEVLLAGRVIQAGGTAVMMPLLMTTLMTVVPESDRGRVMGQVTLAISCAPALGPAVSGVILELGSWRLIFVFLAATGAVLFVVASFALRESLPAGLRRTGGTGAALRTYRDLLLDLPFLGLALMSAFYLSAMFTYVASSTFVFQEGYGLTPQQFGWVFAAGAVAITAGSQINGALVGRFRPEQILSGAVAVGVVLSLSLFATTLLGAPFWTVPCCSAR